MHTLEIRIYPNKLEHDLYELCHAKPGTTLTEWLTRNVPSYTEDIPALFSAYINDVLLEPAQWNHYQLKQKDDVKLIIEAKDPVTATLAVIAAIAVGTALYMATQIPDNYNSTTPDGSSIYSVNAQGNKPRLMGIIPEIAGRHLVFPDYLTMPRREYINNEQWLYLMLSVGKGEYEIKANEIKIGNTPVSRYAGDIDYQVFSPGESVLGHEAHRNVYTSQEVSSTAGQYGIELKGPITQTGGDSGASKYDFNGSSVVMYKTEFEPEIGPITTKASLPFEEGSIIAITNTSEGQNDGKFQLVSKSINGNVMNKLDDNYEDDDAWAGFTAESSSPARMVNESGGGAGEFNGPFFAVPEGEKTDKIWLDFMLPQGLGELDDDGNFLNQTVEIWIEYKDENSSSWVTLAKTFTNATNDQLAETVPFNLPYKMRPEVRVRRYTHANDDTRVYDKVFWTSLKAELESALKYDSLTTIAVKIRGTNALSGSAENKFNVIANRKLPIYENNQWTTPRPTNDIAPFFAHIIRSVGHDDDKIGLDELQQLHAIWKNRNDEFNAVFDSQSTMFEAIKRVLAVGFAEPTIDYGQIVPVRDQKRTIYKHMYQPDNYIGLLDRNIKMLDDDEPDGVEVEYFDPITWKPATVMCLLPEDIGVDPQKIRAFGITNRDKAYQFGMRKRRTRRYRRTRFDFKTEMDALNSRYLDYCALADDIPGYEQTGRVEYIIGSSIYVDSTLEWETSKSYVIALRKPDGTLSGPYSALKGSVSNEVIMSGVLDFIPVLDGSMEPPLFMFGQVDRWCNSVIIRDIKPSSIDKVSVTAELDDARVYLDDDSLSPT